MNSFEGTKQTFLGYYMVADLLCLVHTGDQGYQQMPMVLGWNSKITNVKKCMSPSTLTSSYNKWAMSNHQ